MDDLAKIQKGFPKGFYKKKDKDGNLVLNEKDEPIICKTILDTGNLSELLSTIYKNRIRYNLLTLKIELDDQPIEAGFIKLFYVFLSEMGWACSYKFAQDALLWAASKNKYHPIVEFLENLENDKQIIPADINKISSTYLGTDIEDSLYNNMMKVNLIGMVRRVLERGCKHDTCLVLKGSQGIGKSSFWRILAGDEWFCDTQQDNIKDMSLNIQTNWIFELAELDGMTNKKDAAQIKSLLSSSTDNFRRPYEALTEKHPRPSIFVGTCNRGDFLADSTGSRRFHVIDLGDNPIDLELVQNDKYKIIKGAVIAYRNGAKNYLSPIDQLASNNNNLNYEQQHPFMDAFITWLKDPREHHSENGKTYWGDKVDLTKGITARQVLIHSKCRDGSKISSADYRGAADCLRILGFEQHKQIRTTEGKPRLWKKSD